MSPCLESLLWMMVLISFMWLICYIVDSMKTRSNQTFSQYECGFEPIIWLKINPSLHFSKIGLVFITFDLEMILVISLMNSPNWISALVVMLFVWITLWWEFELKSLSWGN